jgi:alkaline phosphatase D
MSALLRPSRRTLLKGSAKVLLPALAGCSLLPRGVWRKANPFQLGIASGAPAPDGFVIWTRLAPEPLSQDPDAPGGMTGGAVPVTYEIAGDEAMRNIVRRGTAPADPALAYSVHAEIAGLEPGRSYWYRFIAGEAESRVGRAATSPGPGSAVERLKFGFVSCSNYEHGYFSAYRHLADEAPDLVLFLGDYIYEYVDTKPGTVRRHSDGVEAMTLSTYRNRYAQYRMDGDLQRLHATAPALLTWDDHEVQNDYADRWSQTFDDPAAFLKRRAAAYQAFYEHMPLRRAARPNGPAMRLYDRFSLGDLAEISLLDGRQYRSREACYRPPDRGGAHAVTDKACPERLDPKRSMIGAAQEAWLFDGLSRSKARWNIIAQDVMMGQLREKQPDGSVAFWSDDWNGYPASRIRVLDHVYDSKVPNPVVLTGDIHSYWVNDLKRDFDKKGSPVIATELVGTSITAHPAPFELFAKMLPDNPHVKFFESRKRGYVCVELARKCMTARLQAISDEKDIKATLSTLKTFVIEDGRPGAQEA